MTLFNRHGEERKPNVGTDRYRYQAKCNRCGGEGGAQKWAHTGWKCFECGGSGRGKIIEEKLYSADKLAKLNAAAAKRQAKKDAAAAAAREAKRVELERTADKYAADNWAFLETLKAIRGQYWESVRNNLLATQREPSPNLIAAAEAALAKQTADDSSQYVGEIGDRIKMRLTCRHIVPLPKMFYGQAPQAIHVCEDDRGNVVVYKGSGEFFAAGDTAYVMATISEHSIYNDRKQTKIKRPLVVAVVLEKEAV